MNHRLKNYLIGLVVFSLIGCSSSPSPKDKTQVHIDEYNRLIAQQQKIDERTAKILDNALADLRTECSNLRAYKTFLNDFWQKYKRDEADFLTELDKRQSKLYSELYKSIEADNQPKMFSSAKELSSSLDDNQKASLSSLYAKLLQRNKWLTDFKNRSDVFQNRKNALLNYVKALFDDPKFYEKLRLSIEKQLAY